MANAANISIEETIRLLENEFKEFATGFETGMYALWLGSAISRERVVGLDGVLAKLLESLRQRISNAVDCPHYQALSEILDLADLTRADRVGVDFNIAASNWPCLTTVIDRLWNKYSKVLGIEVQGQKLDYLLWDVLDFKNTFSSQVPDAEHLAVGMLVLEGVVSELATANWDALLEAAMVELGQPADFYRVAVRGDDLKGPVATATLYKFHGCANRAIAAENQYRDLLVAREATINQWSSNQNFNEIRIQLNALVSRTRTLMIGLSAQDSNIQLMFGSKGWKWNNKPVPIIFSAQSLTAGQKSILEGAYHPEYEANRDQICADAKLPAFSKQLLLALLLQNISRKIETLVDRVNAPSIDVAGRQMLIEGVKKLRDKAAKHGNADRYGLAITISRLMGRFTEQFLGGRSEVGQRPYAPVHSKPTHQMAADTTLPYTGQIEVATTLGVIGLEMHDSGWEVTVDDPTEITSGALRICVQGVDARIFFASSDDKINGLIKSGAFDPDDQDVVVVCSRTVSQRQQRSPSANLRNGRLTPRYIGVEDLLGSSTSLADFRQRFVAEVGL
ncbi:SIR2 family protein [Noviherbaspirillum suwonense]|uniref:SIR2-like domain-containing protein n=1 Tax=Noviherbaspirillum suwonense TaxID=1224511 RepID=A0ABY1Q852_9BURK|nr:SIR2 family protein [Noviherbaspirillum suwonense]SMP62360.1 SIR2-like domain-containing protein [Noviherbaspirillum suwonense]